MKTFLITGVSSGLGRAFAIGSLDAGHTVIGTVRRQADREAFEALAPGRALSRVLDVTDNESVATMVDEVEAAGHAIDVLVANAGYGVEGVFEETPLDEVRAQFETNVLGVAATIQAVLPHMRQRRAGHITAVTSMGGLMAVPGMSAYCASKFALEGMLESIGKEVTNFGIRVTAIEPGSFRTDWAGRSMTRAERSINDYDELFTPIREARQKASGHQLGDPSKAAAALLQILDDPNPPRHLVLGTDALRLIASARASFDEDVTRWDALSRSTDHAEGAALATS